jgi:hypothetical protein
MKMPETIAKLIDKASTRLTEPVDEATPERPKDDDSIFGHGSWWTTHQWPRPERLSYSRS